MTSQYSQQFPRPGASLYSQFQYQQQNGVQAEQNGMAWDGSKWVATATQTPSSSSVQYSNYTYQQPQQTSPPGCNYELYKYYYEQAVHCKNEAARPGIGEAEKAEALRKAQWAEYYSSQAYYGQVSQPQQNYQIDPPVSMSSGSISSIPSCPSKATLEHKSDEYPESLQRYVRRAVEGYTTEIEKKRAQEMVERVIANAVRNNTLWTTDWDSFSTSKSPTDQPVNNQKIVVSEESKLLSTSFVSSSVVNSRLPNVSPPSKKPRVMEKYPKCGAKPTNDSYYGPASSESSEVTMIQDTQTKGAMFSILSSNGAGKSGGVSRMNSRGADIDHPSPDAADAQEKKTNAAFDVSSSTLAARANRFSDMTAQVKRKYPENLSKDSVNDAFGQYMGIDVIGGRSKLDEHDFERMTVKGTCAVLEKEYLRLTAPPQASKVRPQEILERHLNNLKTMWVRQERDYAWFCSQLKAIRQDLTVQRINNDFSVEVYETHARIALEVADLNEFNQSQTQLKELYKVLRQQKDETVKIKGLRNVNEFIAYRLIYYVFLTLNKKYEGGSTDVMNILLSLTPDQSKDPCISHALKVRDAVAAFDYHAFFRLHEGAAPRMQSYLLDFMVGPVRFAALQRMCKAYRPTLEVKFALAELGYIVGDPRGWCDGIEWLKSCGCLLSDDDLTWNTKDSVVRESTLKKKTSLI